MICQFDLDEKFETSSLKNGLYKKTEEFLLTYSKNHEMYWFLFL